MSSQQNKILVKCERCGQLNAYELLKVTKQSQPVCGVCGEKLLRTTLLERIKSLLNALRIPSSPSRKNNQSYMKKWTRAYLDAAKTAYRFLMNSAFLISAPIIFAVLLQNNNDYKKILSILLCLSIGILATSLHEFLHALVAFLGGDNSVRGRGYLELNPVSYLNQSNSFVIPSMCEASHF
jgi:hypothetical protein